MHLLKCSECFKGCGRDTQGICCSCVGSQRVRKESLVTTTALRSASLQLHAHHRRVGLLCQKSSSQVLKPTASEETLISFCARPGSLDDAGLDQSTRQAPQTAAENAVSLGETQEGNGRRGCWLILLQPRDCCHSGGWRSLLANTCTNSQGRLQGQGWWEKTAPSPQDGAEIVMAGVDSLTPSRASTLYGPSFSSSIATTLALHRYKFSTPDSYLHPRSFVILQSKTFLESHSILTLVLPWT